MPGSNGTDYTMRIFNYNGSDPEIVGLAINFPHGIIDLIEALLVPKLILAGRLPDQQNATVLWELSFPNCWIRNLISALWQLKWYWKEESKWRTVFWLSTYWNSWRPDHCSTELIIWPMVCGYYAFIPVLNCNNGVLLDHQESHLILTPQG
ncbi:hypothetical protein L6452_05672 [Arctium lappa]|uniref:Uncharacterized protein n=1 Tax=Arctium lappa TaxID=4217 RepID=A0ACB9EH14_ARCLA|nr:hypothetical protein L6452_05672 [Arctium lappa]